MILSNAKERTRFLKFAVVGAIGAVVDLGIFNLLISGFNVVPLTAQAVSFSVAVVSNFIWNRLWTYPDARSKPLARQLVQFVVVSVIGLVIRTLIFDSLEQALIALAAVWVPNLLTPTVVGHNLALCIVIGIVMLWNFFINRFWTYNDVK